MRQFSCAAACSGLGVIFHPMADGAGVLVIQSFDIGSKKIFLAKIDPVAVRLETRCQCLPGDAATKALGTIDNFSDGNGQ